MKKKLYTALVMTSMCLAACGAKEEAKETVKATVAVEKSVETEEVAEETEAVAEETEAVAKETEAVAKETEESVELPEVTGEFTSLNVNGNPVTFGKTTIEELDTVFDDGKISEDEALAAMFGMPTAINSEKLKYKFHFYDMGMLAFGVEVKDGVTPVIGYMVDNDKFKLDDEIRTLTADDLTAKFGEYTTGEDGNFIWDTEEAYITAIYEDGEISTFIIVNKDMASFAAPYLQTNIDNYVEEVPEIIEVVSKGNLEGEFTTTFNIGEYQINLGDSITEDDKLDEYLYDKFDGRSSMGISGNYTWTYGGWNDGNALNIGGVETEVTTDEDGDEITTISIKSVGMDIADPETIEVEQFKGLTLSGLKEELGTPYNDGTELVWENDGLEIRVEASDDRIVSIDISDFEFAYDRRNEADSFMDVDFESVIDETIMQEMEGKTPEEFASVIVNMITQM